MTLAGLWCAVALAAPIALPRAHGALVLPAPDSELTVDAAGRIAVGRGGQVVEPVAPGELAPELLEALLLEAPVSPRVRVLVDERATAGSVRTAIAAARVMNASFVDLAAAPGGGRGFTLTLSPDVDRARTMLDTPLVDSHRFGVAVRTDSLVLGFEHPVVLPNNTAGPDWDQLAARLTSDGRPGADFTVFADDGAPWSTVFAVVAAAGAHGYTTVRLFGLPAEAPALAEHGVTTSPGAPPAARWVILGELDRDTIAAAILSQLHPIRTCYNTELALTPTLAGKIVARFVIQEDGTVHEVRFDASLGSDRMDQCVAAALRQLTFPAPRGGGMVLVSYPFVFIPQ